MWLNSCLLHWQVDSLPLSTREAHNLGCRGPTGNSSEKTRDAATHSMMHSRAPTIGHTPSQMIIVQKLEHPAVVPSNPIQSWILERTGTLPCATPASPPTYSSVAVLSFQPWSPQILLIRPPCGICIAKYFSFLKLFAYFSCHSIPHIPSPQCLL